MKAPTRFLCVRKQNSFSEIMKVTHTVGYPRCGNDSEAGDIVMILVCSAAVAGWRNVDCAGCHIGLFAASVFGCEEGNLRSVVVASGSIIVKSTTMGIVIFSDKAWITEIVKRAFRLPCLLVRRPLHCN